MDSCQQDFYRKYAKNAVFAIWRYNKRAFLFAVCLFFIIFADERKTQADKEMERFFQTHSFWMDHTKTSVRRALMDSIDWSYRLIGIRGARGVGRTSFLLQYAKENFDPNLHQCLFISMNNFYFQGRGIVDFAGTFVARGGQVLLIDQMFKLQNWKEQLLECYRRYPHLRIIFTTTSVPDSEEENSELSAICRFYNLHGFSFREFLNQQTGNDFRACSLSEIIKDHELLMKSILPKVRPWEYFQNYLHHGFYPFYIENRNFTESLLKAMNSMIETDILLSKQIELKYLPRIKKLLYLLAVSEESAPNVSKLAEEIGTSRATVMNYLKYLEEGRFINLIFREGDTFPKKPAMVRLHNTNLMYALYSPNMDEQSIYETFFVNSLWRHHQVNKGRRDGFYLVNETTNVCVCDKLKRVKAPEDTFFARYNLEVGRGNDIPIWLFGFLY